MNKKERNSIFAQGMAWLEGNPIHNILRNECTPDFSCCRPELFVTDRRERLRTVNIWNRNNGYAEVPK